jgi:broad specificity phosphatase PhoE
MAIAQLRLHLLAHAPTRAQREFRFSTPDDPIEQPASERLAGVSAQVEGCQWVWCGPERRCLETADALGLGATPDDALRAWSPGTWASQSLASVADRDPTGFAAWRTDPNAVPHVGESLSTLLSRVEVWVDAQADTSGRALLIADPSVIRALVVHVLQAGPATFWRFDIPPLSLSVVQHASSQWRLRHLVLLD